MSPAQQPSRQRQTPRSARPGPEMNSNSIPSNAWDLVLRPCCPLSTQCPPFPGLDATANATPLRSTASPSRTSLGSSRPFLLSCLEAFYITSRSPNLRLSSRRRRQSTSHDVLVPAGLEYRNNCPSRRKVLCIIAHRIRRRLWTLARQVCPRWPALHLAL